MKIEGPDFKIPLRGAQESPQLEKKTESIAPEDNFKQSSPRHHKLTLLYTNDMHGNVEALKSRESPSESSEGGLAYLGRAISQEKEKNPDSTLVLDAGDISTGGAVSDYFRAIPIVEAMNQMGYDAMTVGNHDLDAGRKSLKNIADTAQFPVLSANLVDTTPGESMKLLPYTFKQVGPLKIGILGLTTPDAYALLQQADKERISFKPPAEIARELIPEMKEQGADLVIVLSHLGIEGDRGLATLVEGIDVIVGGHTHTSIENPEKVNGTLIVQAGSHNKNVGKLELDIIHQGDRTEVAGAQNRLIPINDREIEPDRFVEKIIKKYIDKLAPIMSRVIGHARVPLTQRDYHKYMEESPLCNFAADALREKAGTEIFIISPSSLRSNINEGEITVGDIYRLFPFDRRLTTQEMKGQDIKNVMEEMISGPMYGIAISGMNVEIDTERPTGDKVISVTMPDGAPLDPHKSYSVGTYDWMADGNGNMPSFKKGKNRQDSIEMKDALISAVEGKKILLAANDMRITNIALS